MNVFNKSRYVIEGKFIVDQLMLLHQIFLSIQVHTGFQPNHSTINALTEFTSEILNSTENQLTQFYSSLSRPIQVFW